MILTQREMRAELRRQVEAAGGVVAWCRRHNISHTPVSLMLNGVRPVSEAVGNCAGFISETVFKKV